MSTILVMITTLVSVWVWSYPKWYVFVVAFLWGIRILKIPKGKWHHIMVSVLVSVSFLSMPQSSRLNTQQHIFEAHVNARDIHVNGDTLRMKMFIDGEVVNGYYRLPNQNEQAFYMQNISDLTIQVIGELKTLEPSRTPYVFDFKRYAYEQYRQFYHLDIQKIKVINKQTNWISALKYRIQSVVPKGVYEWIDVLFFGGRWAMDTQETLQQLGVLWLFSLSGIHIQWVIQLIRKLSYRLNITKATVAKISVLISALFLCFAPHKLAPWKVFWQLGFKKWFDWIVITYILINPFIIYTLAFQLSFGCTILSRFEKSRYVVPLFIAIILSGHYYQFYYLSYFLVPLFLIGMRRFILPVVLYSFLSGVVGVPFPLLTIIDEWLNIFEKTLSAVMNGKTFAWNTGRYHDLIYVVLFIIGIAIVCKGKQMKKLTGVVLVVIAVLLVIPKPATRLVMIDVGQGDSFLIQKGYDTVLIDTGGRVQFEKDVWRTGHQSNQFHQKVTPLLRGMGIQNIDAILLSHADSDHSGDLPVVQKDFSVGNIIFGTGAPIDGSLAVSGRQSIKVGNISLDILYPLKDGKGENEDSLIVYTVVDNTSILFTGDALMTNEMELLNLYPNLTVDVLKVGHHGSKTSTSSMFVEQLQPKIALISAGQNNRFHHPHTEVLKRLEGVMIYRTDTNGTVIFESGKWTPFLSE